MRLLASFVALLALGSACKKADEGDAEVGPPTVPAAQEQALTGHAFFRLTGTRHGSLDYYFRDQPIDFALDRHANYYLGVGSRVLVLDPGGAEPQARVLGLPAKLELLGIHDDRLILFGPDDARCLARKSTPHPLVFCGNVFRRATEDEAEAELVAAFDALAPALAGDHVVAVEDNTLMSLPLTKGEVRRLALEGIHGFEVQVQADRLLWVATVFDEPRSRLAVFQSRAPFDDAERVFDLEKTRETEDIVDVAWIGDGIAYLVRAANQDVQLYRRIGEQTDLLLSGLGPTARLEHHSSAAWLLDGNPGAERLWRIEPEEHRPMTFATTPMYVTGTSWGLVWVEQDDTAATFHLSGSADLEPPELPERLLFMPVDPGG